MKKHNKQFLEGYCARLRAAIRIAKRDKMFWQRLRETGEVANRPVYEISTIAASDLANEFKRRIETTMRRQKQ